MNQKFLQFITNSRNRDELNSTIPYTSNEEIIEVINSLQTDLQIQKLSKTEEDIFFNFLEQWKCNFKQIHYDDFECDNIIRSYSFPIRLKSYSKPLYCIFNIDYLNSIKDSFNQYEITKNELINISYDKSIKLNSFFYSNENGILIDSFLEPRFILVDGNHRFVNNISLNYSFIVNVIPFEFISKEMFINDFNFFIFKFINFYVYIRKYNYSYLDELKNLSLNLSY